MIQQVLQTKWTAQLQLSNMLQQAATRPRFSMRCLLVKRRQQRRQFLYSCTSKASKLSIPALEEVAAVAFAAAGGDKAIEN